MFVCVSRSVRGGTVISVVSCPIFCITLGRVRSACLLLVVLWLVNQVACICLAEPRAKTANCQVDHGWVIVCEISSGKKESQKMRQYWAVKVLEAVRRRSFRRKLSFHVPCSWVIDTDVESSGERAGWLSFRYRPFGLSTLASGYVRVVVGRPVSTTEDRVGRGVSARCRCVTITVVNKW